MTERIEKLKKFLESSPNDCFLHHALALEYIKVGEEESAKSHFEQNLIKDPSYVATYYHLGKLLERSGQQQTAIDIYAKGMVVAKAAKDMHAYSELQAAWEDLVY